MDKKKMFAGGIMLAICATAGYLLLEDLNLEQITKNVKDTFELPEQPCC